MGLEKFLGERVVRDSTTMHETNGHTIEISIDSDAVVVTCIGQTKHSYPPMTYLSQGPERLEGLYTDGHLLTITRRPDGMGISASITGRDPDTGSWTADDSGEGGGE